MLPAEKLDLILRRHEEIGHRLSEGVDSSAFSTLSRELAELEPVAAAIRAYRSLEAGNRRPRRNGSPTRGLDADMRALAEEELRGAETPAGRSWSSDLRLALLPQASRRTRKAPSSKCAPAPAATRRRCSPATCSACTSAMPSGSGWKVEIVSASEGDGRRLQGDHRRDRGRGRVRAAEVRERRASRAARARPPRRRGASTLRPPPSPCCRRPRRSISTINEADLQHRHDARAAAPAASTSTRPNRRSASPTFRPASW